MGAIEPVCLLLGGCPSLRTLDMRHNPLGAAKAVMTSLVAQGAGASAAGAASWWPPPPPMTEPTAARAMELPVPQAMPERNASGRGWGKKAREEGASDVDHVAAA